MFPELLKEIQEKQQALGEGLLCGQTRKPEKVRATDKRYELGA